MWQTGRMRRHLNLSLQALRSWSARRWAGAAVATLVVGLALGVVTVLIPNPIFGREIPPTAWSYPAWIVTSVLSGMLIATYFRSGPKATADAEDEKLSVWGTVGAFGAWFAIGCPVCNKIALLALGYTGALTYFGPLQPWLAALSLILLAVGLVFRLSGSIACPVPQRRRVSVAQPS